MRNVEKGGYFEQRHKPGEKWEYSPGFIDRVKKEFPDDKNLHKELDAGTEGVGFYLEQHATSSKSNIQPEDIIVAFENGKERDLLEAAQGIKRRADLFGEWNTEYRFKKDKGD